MKFYETACQTAGQNKRMYRVLIVKPFLLIRLQMFFEHMGITESIYEGVVTHFLIRN